MIVVPNTEFLNALKVRGMNSQFRSGHYNTVIYMRVISVYEEMMRFFMNNLYYGHLVYIILGEQHFHMNLAQKKKLGYTSVGSVGQSIVPFDGLSVRRSVTLFKSYPGCSFIMLPWIEMMLHTLIFHNLRIFNDLDSR